MLVGTAAVNSSGISSAFFTETYFNTFINNFFRNLVIRLETHQATLGNFLPNSSGIFFVFFLKLHRKFSSEFHRQIFKIKNQIYFLRIPSKIDSAIWFPNSCGFFWNFFQQFHVGNFGFSIKLSVEFPKEKSKKLGSVFLKYLPEKFSNK